MAVRVWRAHAALSEARNAASPRMISRHVVWMAGTLKAAASPHSGDFEIQLGCALANDNDRDRARALNTLTARLPRRASLNAAILRNAGFDINLSRDNDAVVSVIAGRTITSLSLRLALRCVIWEPTG